MGSPYSVLYAPHLLIATTLTGQLSILMLIERAEAAGIPVVSANTDGVVFYCPRRFEGELDVLLRTWEAEVGLTVERTPYRALYNSSVNTYLAIKEDGKVKRKGYIADPWSEGDPRGQMMKNPQMTVCSEAVLRLVTEGTPIEMTIRTCRDPRAFVTVIKVNGGGVWRGHALGRAVRYYWALGGEPIYYASSIGQKPRVVVPYMGNDDKIHDTIGSSRKVAKTDGARPLGELTGELPPDLDYLRYCEEAARLAAEIGVPAGEVR